jgi:hypothetical protein
VHGTYAPRNIRATSVYTRGRPAGESVLVKDRFAAVILTPYALQGMRSVAETRSLSFMPRIIAEEAPRQRDRRKFDVSVTRRAITLLHKCTKLCQIAQSHESISPLNFLI